MAKKSVVNYPRVFEETVPDSVTVGSTSTEITGANNSRKYAIFVNDSDEIIYLSLGSAAVMNKGIRLNANGGAYEIKDGFFSGVVYGICTSGSKNLTYIDV